MIDQYKTSDPVWSFRVSEPRELDALVNSKGTRKLLGGNDTLDRQDSVVNSGKGNIS